MAFGHSILEIKAKVCRLSIFPSNMRDARKVPSGSNFASPGKSDRPFASGASSLCENNNCIPRQMPSIGVFSETTALIMASSKPILRKYANEVPKFPTPGRISFEHFSKAQV